MNSDTLNLPPAIDQEVIDKLMASIKKKEPILEIFDIFEKNAVEKIDLFKKAATNGDYYLIHLAAHAIKGSAFTVGANYFAELCDELEVITNPEDPIRDAGQIWNLIKQIDKEYERVIQEIYQLIPNL